MTADATDDSITHAPQGETVFIPRAQNLFPSPVIAGTLSRAGRWKPSGRDDTGRLIPLNSPRDRRTTLSPRRSGQAESASMSGTGSQQTINTEATADDDDDEISSTTELEHETEPGNKTEIDIDTATAEGSPDQSVNLNDTQEHEAQEDDEGGDPRDSSDIMNSDQAYDKTDDDDEETEAYEETDEYDEDTDTDTKKAVEQSDVESKSYTTLDCKGELWCSDDRARKMEAALNDLAQKSRSRTTKFIMPLICPFRHKIGVDCTTQVKTVGELLRHVKTKHTGTPALATTRMLIECGLVERCNRCRVVHTTRGMQIHKARCDVQTLEPKQIKIMQARREQDWQWELLTQETMMRLCTPGVQCVEYIHPHVVGKVAIVCKKIREAKVSRDKQIFATILLLQTITNHSRFKKHRMWKAQELKRLWQFKNGDWAKLIQNIQTRAASAQDKWAHAAEDDIIEAEARRGKIRDIIFGGSHTVIPSLHEVQSVIMPTQHNVIEEKEDETDQDSSSAFSDEIEIDRESLKQAIKHVGSVRSVTGVAAGVWGQLLETEPEVVEEMIQEQIKNTMPTAARNILTGVQYRVIGYDDSQKLRPVGSLDAIVKIAQVYLLKAEKLSIDIITRAMIDHAVGTPNGMAKTISTLKAQTMAAIEEKQQDFAILKVDIKSAFPLSDRVKMRTAVRQYLPKLLGIFDFLYNDTNHHIFMTRDQGVCRVQQEQGIIQGSELSMLFFGVYSHQPLVKMLPKIGDYTLKYADDFFLHGKVDTVIEQFQEMRTEFKQQTGLDFSEPKSELYLPAANASRIQEITSKHKVRTTNQGITVLGVPIGHTDFTMEALGKKATIYQSNIQRCVRMCTKQIILSILQHTASESQHIVAVLPPEETHKFAQQIDRVSYNVLREHIFDTPDPQLSDPEWENILPRTKMSLRAGGLGVLSLEHRAPMAFVTTQYHIQQGEDEKSRRVAKWLANTPMQRKHETAMIDAAELHIEYANRKDDQDPEPLDKVCDRIRKMTMRQLMEPLNAMNLKAYTAHCTDEAAKAFTATKQKGANDVLTVRPNRSETTLNDLELRFAIHQRFGLLDKLFTLTDGSDKCRACAAQNLTGAHFASCGHSRKQRHDEIVVAHLRVLDAAGINARTEVQMHHAQRKIDIFYTDPQPESAATQRVMADVTIQQAYQPIGPQLPNTRQILQRASKQKVQKYTNDAAAWRAYIQPLTYTTFGAISMDARQWIDRIEQAAIAGAHHFPEIERRFKVVWRENISFDILRATVAAATRGIQQHRAEVALLLDDT